MGETPFFASLFSSRVITTLENFKYTGDAQTSMLQLLVFLNVFQILILLRVKHLCVRGHVIPTSTAAIPTPMMSTVATPTPVTSAVATPTPMTGTVATEPENQAVQVSITPIQKKRYIQKNQFS